MFRAAENRVTFAVGATSGLSVVVDPYGHIVAERSVISGEVFTTPGRTLYTRWGNWCGWLTVVSLLGMIGWAILRNGDNNL